MNKLVPKVDIQEGPQYIFKKRKPALFPKTLFVLFKSFQKLNLIFFVCILLELARLSGHTYS
jgi:hypothetical protein